MCTIIEGDSKVHLLTYGLGPCVGVAIVIKNHDGKVSRLLAHVDMGQIIGISFDNLKSYFRRIRNGMGNDIESIEISLSSTQSFFNMKFLNENETKLLAIILKEFEKYGISISNIKFNYSSQVQISPNGSISTYSNYEIKQHKQSMLNDVLNELGGYVHPKLNIYITSFGAYIGNCSLGLNCTDQEKQELLSHDYWKEYINKGYELVVAPSFNDSQHQAVYVSNWQEVIDPKWGVVVGCLQAETNNSVSDSMRIMEIVFSNLFSLQ